MKKILKSVLTIAVVAAFAVGVSQAFFSDTETSSGNTFTAGAIDLLIDNDSWHYGANGVWTLREDLTWGPTDIDGHLFFDYADMKPGDMGEDTVSIRVDNNDAWACVDLYVTRNDDMSSTEPELEAGDVLENPQDVFDGELAENIYVAFWVDDGDNVYEQDEEMLTAGPASDAIQGLHYVLADSQENNVGGAPGDPLIGEQTYNIGKFWCYGVMGGAPLPPSDYSGPADAGPGFTCDGAPVDNMSQTDQMTVDISFYAVQARHNGQFVCEGHYTPADMTRLRLENKTGGWEVIVDGRYGILDFESAAPTFNYTLNVYGMDPTTEYALHYYKDPWPSNGGIIIDTFTTDASGNWSGSNSVELNTDLPVVGDGNWPSAKIWIVPRDDLHADGHMVAWHQSELLFEWNLVTYDDTDI